MRVLALQATALQSTQREAPTQLGQPVSLDPPPTNLTAQEGSEREGVGVEWGNRDDTVWQRGFRGCKGGIITTNVMWLTVRQERWKQLVAAVCSHSAPVLVPDLTDFGHPLAINNCQNVVWTSQIYLNVDLHPVLMLPTIIKHWSCAELREPWLQSKVCSQQQSAATTQWIWNDFTLSKVLCAQKAMSDPIQLSLICESMFWTVVFHLFLLIQRRTRKQNNDYDFLY